MDNIYKFKVKSIKGEEISLDKYKNKVILIVNTASNCGFTKQYEALETIHKKFKDKGLVVLGFPCNQFGNQEQGNSQEIQNFCEKNYGVTFELMQKTEVNGNNENPLYSYLKKAQPGLLTNSIKWNFTKFLINKQGVAVKRFKPATIPEKIEKDIEALL